MRFDEEEIEIACEKEYIDFEITLRIQSVSRRKKVIREETRNRYM